MRASKTLLDVDSGTPAEQIACSTCCAAHTDPHEIPHTLLNGVNLVNSRAVALPRTLIGARARPRRPIEPHSAFTSVSCPVQVLPRALRVSHAPSHPPAHWPLTLPRTTTTGCPTPSSRPSWIACALFTTPGTPPRPSRRPPRPGPAPFPCTARPCSGPSTRRPRRRRPHRRSPSAPTSRHPPSRPCRSSTALLKSVPLNMHLQTRRKSKCPRTRTPPMLTT